MPRLGGGLRGVGGGFWDEEGGGGGEVEVEGEVEAEFVEVVVQCWMSLGGGVKEDSAQ